ncbi:ATP-binding protein [Thermodesulfobacteriota bacterium]
MAGKPTYDELKQKISDLENEIAGRGKKDAKIEHLNLILRAIRNVNQLLVFEKDRKRLLQGTCDNLTENRGYYNAWIALLAESGSLIAAAEAGLGEEFQLLEDGLKNGEIPDCVRKALSQSSLILTEDPFSSCLSCPMATKYFGRGAMTIRLSYDKKIFGVLCVSIPRELVLDEEEQELFNEVAGDIAFGLYRIELEEKHRQADEIMQKSMHELNERVKELNCLFDISSLFEKRNISLAGILNGTVDLIPSAFQHPEITCARIILKGKEFKTRNFRETNWRQVKDIIVHDEPLGRLEVCYLEKRPEADADTFLDEERALINAIAGRLGRVTERKQAEEALKKSEQRFRDLVENSIMGISIFQDDQIVYQNPEQEKMLGPLPRKLIITDLENIYPEDVEKVKQFYRSVVAGEGKFSDMDFRFYPTDKRDRRLDMKWVYCRANQIEYQQKPAILVNIVDITKVKELEHLVRVQDKMASLGHVAAGIAHEIRNPLSGINIYLDTLEKIYEKGESLGKVKAIFGQLQSASRKIESVVKRVMDFSKPSAPKFVLTDLNQPIEEAIKLSAVTLRKTGIKIEKALAEELPPHYIDFQLIEEVILNLITNAAEAMKDMEGIKKIEISSFTENEFILVKVSDTGAGVASDLKDKIFDPFYTTKNGNTGIGLSIAHRIIVDHGGFLDVFPNRFGGAEFQIKIPVEKGTVAG